MMMLLGLVLFLQPKHEHGGSTALGQQHTQLLTTHKKWIGKWETGITALEWSLSTFCVPIYICLSVYRAALQHVH